MAPNGRAGTILTVFVGALLLLMGLVLTAGGIWLATLGGSLYYLLAGMALAISGWLILRRSAAGVWLYVAVFVVTVIWALWEVGLDAWALVPRIFAPGVLLILVLAVLASWRGGRRNSLLPLGGAVAASLVFKPLTGVLRASDPRVAGTGAGRERELRLGGRWGRC